MVSWLSGGVQEKNFSRRFEDSPVDLGQISLVTAHPLIARNPTAKEPLVLMDGLLTSGFDSGFIDTPFCMVLKEQEDPETSTQALACAPV